MMQPNAQAWTNARSILAVRLDGIGDLLMTTPALRALKESRDDRTLALLTSPAAAETACELPFVDDVIVAVAPWMKSAETTEVSPADVAALATGLRARSFDAGIVFTVFTQSALPAAMLLFDAGIPLRAAYSRENPYALLTDWRPDPDRDPRAGVRHEVARHIELVRSLGFPVADQRLQFPVRSAARAGMRAKARAAGMRVDRPWLVVHPGATAPSRRYPESQLVDAVATLARQGRWRIAVAGAGEDAATAHAIAEAVPGVVSLAGLLDLRELAALLQAAEIVVCNNSSPAHLAAAVGTPVVDLYALTNPQHTPWGVRHRVLSHDVECRHCLKSVCPHGHMRCLAGVRPSEIVAAVRSLVAETQARAAPAAVVTAGAAVQ
jgi:lipopolysaccharide heptosyltransferase II